MIFKGKVKAEHKFCRKLRVVKLIKNPGKVIEKDITGGRGRYKVTWEAHRVGTFFFHTRVKPKVGGVHPHRHA